MSSQTTYAVAFAVVGMGTRFLVHMMGWDYSWSTQLYFLFLLLAVFFGTKEYFQNSEERTFGKLFKAGAQVSAIFSLLVTIFTFIFYRFVATGFFSTLIESRLQEAQANGYTTEQIEQLQGNLEFVFSANTQSTATLIGFMVLGFTYAVVVSLVFTKLPFFARPLK